MLKSPKNKKNENGATPTPVSVSPIAGVWESIGLYPYTRLTYSEKSTSTLVFIRSNGDLDIFQIKEVKKGSDSFILTAIDHRSKEPIMFEALYFANQIRLTEQRNDAYAIWMIRQTSVNDMRKRVSSVLKSIFSTQDN